MELELNLSVIFVIRYFMFNHVFLKENFALRNAKILEQVLNLFQVEERLEFLRNVNGAKIFSMLEDIVSINLFIVLISVMLLGWRGKIFILKMDLRKVISLGVKEQREFVKLGIKE